MIKYDGYYVAFQEVPDEVSLVFNITNCQGECEGCHSPWLRNDYGQPLLNNMEHILKKYEGMITCVCFMGEGNDPFDLRNCVRLAKLHRLSTCIYSGADDNHWNFYETDYYKYGSYQKKLGGLDSPYTNQRMLHYTKKANNSYCTPKDVTRKLMKEYQERNYK